MWKPSVALGKGLCVGLEILTELSTTFVLICMYMMAGPPGDPRGTGLAKKFVWVFSKHLQKTWMNFLVNPVYYEPRALGLNQSGLERFRDHNIYGLN